MGTGLQRTFGTPTNNKIFTLSLWLKRAAGDTDATIPLMQGGGSSRPTSEIVLNSEAIALSQFDGAGYNYNVRAYYKAIDVSAWYHIVYIFDSTQSTASDRVKFYMNGVLQNYNMQNTSYPSLNYVPAMNGATSHGIGGSVFGAFSGDAECIMSHIHFADGTAYDPSYFGETDSTTGQWKIKTDVSVTYGNNGFFILKDGNSVTDQSGNSNNWTVGAGTLTKTEDSPSNVFATLNPLVRNKSYNEGTLTNGNLGFAPNGRAVTCSTLGVTSGKYYAEFKATDAGGIYLGAGLMKGITSQGQTYPIWYDNAEGFAIAIADNGNLESGTNQGSTSYGASFTDNDIIGIALDMDNKEMYIHKNGTYMNSGDPTSGASKTGGVTGATSYNPFDDGEEVFFMVADISAAGVGECQCNFGNGYFGTTAVTSAGTNASGNGIFEYDVPTGYTALTTKGLNL